MALVQWTGGRFRTIGWVSLVLLLATGLFSLSHRGHGWWDPAGEFWRTVFGRTLAVKLGLFVLVLVLSALHDFHIGPRAGAAGRRDPDSAAARRLRRQASWLGRLNFLLTLAILALAVALVRGWP